MLNQPQEDRRQAYYQKLRRATEMECAAGIRHIFQQTLFGRDIKWFYSMQEFLGQRLHPLDRLEQHSYLRFSRDQSENRKIRYLKEYLQDIKENVDIFFGSAAFGAKLCIGVIILDPLYDELIFKGLKPSKLYIEVDSEVEEEEEEEEYGQNFEVMEWDQNYIVVAGTESLTKGNGYKFNIREDLRLIEINRQNYLSNIDKFSEMDPENSIKQKVLGELPILTNITPVRGRTSLETHLIDSLNQNQKNALFNCFNQDFTIVQGPPGTGKTRLITHILLMMMNRNKKARILVCGDSNQSVDNLCVAFIELLDELDKNPEFANLQFATNFKDRFVRFSSFHAAALGESNPALKEHLVYLLRPIGTVQTESRHERREIQKKNEEIELINRRVKNRINDAQIVFCTLAKASRIESYFQRDPNEEESDWDESSDEMKIHINFKEFKCGIVDEASQTIEMNSLSIVKHSLKKLILVGDQKQLDPVIQDDRVRDELGIKSIFNRLVLDGAHQCFLNEQYRMSSRLRAIISEVFYNGQLIDASVIEQRQIPVDLQQIFPGTDNPAKFRQTNGFESRICRSYYNDEQAQITADYLYRLKRTNMDFSKLGVICAYKPQVFKIKNILRQDRRLRQLLKKIRINTVDAFQGSECDFIIINTVRSNGDGRIGFLENSKRLNVAISRARFGIVMIGNQDTLTRQSLMWQQIIARFEVILPPPESGEEDSSSNDNDSDLIKNFAEFNLEETTYQNHTFEDEPAEEDEDTQDGAEQEEYTDYSNEEEEQQNYDDYTDESFDGK